MKQVFPSEWRTQNKFKRKVYSKYMGWLEKVGYLLVLGVLVAFVFAFTYKVEDVIKADGVVIQGKTVTISATGTSHIARLLVAPGTEVKAGQPLVELVEGEEAIRQFLKWQSVADLQTRLGNVAEVATLIGRYQRPRVKTISAEQSGTFYASSKLEFAEGEEIGKVVDYSTLEVSASLEGQTVAKAAVGQIARITSLSMGSTSGTLFRGSGERALLSSRLLSEEVKSEIETGLQGSYVQLRDDVPLSVTGVSDVQIDAKVESKESTDGGALPLDPATNYSIAAEVVSGIPVAVVQVASLPAQLQSRIETAIDGAVKGKVVTDVLGKTYSIADVSDIRTVVKLKVKGQAEALSQKLDASLISRKYDATLRLTSPPTFLVDAVRRADANGTTVTGRAELVTGTRPIAFILLKKS